MKISKQLEKKIKEMIVSCQKNIEQINVNLNQLTIGKFKLEGAREMLESFLQKEEQGEKKDGK